MIITVSDLIVTLAGYTLTLTPSIPTLARPPLTFLKLWKPIRRLRIPQSSQNTKKAPHKWDAFQIGKLKFYDV
ncbi:hypothetical protein CF394_11640 [Tetzosporium hominis]|uniref:Uncharacterized protein n=1 Tax=Tetzosporium hominis TaxID=2020506 RepID=A0A264W1F4_9BACL|nr:hypothetical protein CF394_11640 [Tetzosporium hominis]